MSSTRFALAKNWFTRLYYWIKESKYFIPAGVLTLALVVFALRKGATEPEIRITGLVLQLMGVLTVVLDVHANSRFFNQLSPWEKSMNWLSRFPRYGSVIRTSVGSSVSQSYVTGVAGLQVEKAAEGSSLERRVIVAERNIESIAHRLVQNQGEFNTACLELRNALNMEGQSRAEAIEKALHKLESFGTGGLSISAIGALWLFIGVVFGTASPELAKLWQ